MGNAYYAKKWQCPRCAKWIGRRQRATHQRQHSERTARIKAANGIGTKPRSEKGRLKAKAKRELSLVNICAYCQLHGDIELDRGPDGLHWHMDHVMPFAEWGIEDLENYVKSCATCNIKRNKTKKMPDGSAMTAAHLTWRSTGLYRRMMDEGVRVSNTN